MSVLIFEGLTQQITSVFLMAFAGFVLSMALTPVYTHFAYKYKWWKQNRTEDIMGNKTPVFTKLHAAKIAKHFPMMAGLIFVSVITLLTFLFNLDRSQTWLPLAALLGGAVVGLIDDIINLRGLGGKTRGMRSSVKFALITGVGLLGAWFFYYKLGYHTVHLPFPPFDLDVGLLIIPIFAFAVVATGNAVNIADGVDGLSGGLSTMAFGTFGLIAVLQGNIGIATFCFTVAGTLLAYLWFNIYPARFFMSDVGSFALGTSLGVVAMLTDTLFLLPIIGFVFVADTATVIIQMFSKKFFHRKIFLSSPVHHHFEAIGWPESKVTMRFWIIGLISAALGLIVAFAGGYV